MPADAEAVVSSLGTQAKVDAVCKKYGIPTDQYTARPAGDLRASSAPPPGSVCVYGHALEAGMRVPLHGLFSDALAHFGIAPAQLVPNGWRIMAGFVVLCHYAGVPLSLAVFRHFFRLRIINNKKICGWYLFQSIDTSGLRFAGLPDSIKDWKQSFFFLASPTPWRCPVEWGEPSKSSFKDVSSRQPSCRRQDISRIAGTDAANTAAFLYTYFHRFQRDVSLRLRHDENIRTEKMATTEASASVNKVKSKPGSDAAWSSPLCGKKRSLDEADRKEDEGRPPSAALNTPPSAHGCSLPPAGDSDFMGILKAANKMISSLEEELKQAKDEVAAVKAEHAASKLEATAEQEKAKAKIAAAKRTADAELEKVKAELTAAKRTADADLKKVKAELAEAKQTGEAELEKVKAELAAVKQVAKEDREKADAERATLQQFLAGLEDLKLKATTSTTRKG